MVKQEDGAGLHRDRTYLEDAERDWLLFNQITHSPVTNIHGACVFPMMSKAVSASQGVVYGSQNLKGEQ